MHCGKYLPGSNTQCSSVEYYSAWHLSCLNCHASVEVTLLPSTATTGKEGKLLLSRLVKSYQNNCDIRVDGGFSSLDQNVVLVVLM